VPNLQKLKIRLEKLPQIEKELKLAASFEHYTQNVSSSRKILGKVKKDIKNVTRVFPNSDCQMEVFPLVQSIAKEAKKLYEEIEKDPWSIEKKATDNRFVRLSENTDSTRNQCDLIWNEEITASIANWEKLASVVHKLGVKGGQAFKHAVDNLKIWENRIPQNDNEVNQVNSAIKALQKGIANIGLKGSFGNFLKSTVENGASPKDLFNDDIKKKLDEYELWDAFRVRLE